MQQLEKLLGISKKEFYSDYQGQRYRHVLSASATCFDDALQLSDIETYLASVPLVHGQVQLVNHNIKPRANQFLKLDDGHIAGNVLDIQKLLDLLKDDTTAIFTDMAKYIPKLSRYCEQLENELGVRLQANIYITPPGSQGFNVHIDSHDVFILQLFGEKNWHLYEGIVEYPTKNIINRQKKFSDAEHELLADIEMKPGDLLYVPQGMYHDASTLDEPSVHITLGILPSRRSELLKILLEGAKDSDYFRRYLPLAMEDKSVKEGFTKEFKAACHQLIEEVDIEELLREASNQFSGRQAPDLDGALSNYLTMNQLSISSRVLRRPEIRYRLEHNQWFTVVHFYQEKIEVPKPIEHILDIILGKEPFSPKDISTNLSDKVKLDFVKKFIGKGLLNIINL